MTEAADAYERCEVMKYAMKRWAEEADLENTKELCERMLAMFEDEDTMAGFALEYRGWMSLKEVMPDE